MNKFRKLCAAGFAFYSLCSVCVPYYQGLMIRLQASAWHAEQSTANGGIYTAQYALVDPDNVVVRIYRTADNKILAERTFRDPYWSGLAWERLAVIYKNGSAATLDDGAIALPPHWTDRLSALLP